MFTHGARLFRTATARETETTLRGRAINRLRKAKRAARALVRLPIAATTRVVAAVRGATLRALRDFGLKRPRLALALARLALRASGRADLPRGAEALLRARVHGWTPDLASADAPPGAAAALLAPPAPTPPMRLATPGPRRPGGCGRVVLYTARFGDAPALQAVAGAPEGVTLLCFTDRPRSVLGWREVETAADPLALARCKILAAEALRDAAPDAEASLWLDPDQLIIGDLQTLIQRWAASHAFMLWRHPASVDWSDLAERRLVGGLARAAVVAQAAGCAADALPRGTGCFDTAVIWRRHGVAAVEALMRRWFDLEASAPGADDLSLLRALAAEDAPRPVVPPLSLGAADQSLFFARSTRRSVQAPKAKALAAPGLRRTRVPLTFVYSTFWTNSATTLLRGKQLSELIASRHGDIYDVAYTNDLDAVRDRIVIATNEVMLLAKRPTLESLKRRNAALIGSWEDARPDPDKMPLLDAVMTLSFPSALVFERLWPRVPAFHVTHNVNKAVPVMTPPEDRLRTGYFGYFPNTVRPASLGGEVDLVSADPIGLLAKGISTDWIDALPHYNCHWIVRRSLPTDGWKPFLKGFVAARCGSPVIVTRSDENAAYYLGDDYPFYAESTSDTDLEAAWARTAGAFGGPDWRLARDVMRQVAVRSSDEQVAADFKAMIDAVTS